MSQNESIVFYSIHDCGDGSARIQFFKTREAMNLYLERNEEEGYENYDLSEGGNSLTQKDIDEAMDVDDVNAEFDQ
jgi:hypothetical protein